MYRKPHVNQLAFEDFVLPFGGNLCSDNRWVILAKQIPGRSSRRRMPNSFPKKTWARPRSPPALRWAPSS